MKLRFEVDQAEAFRQGIDVPKSIVTIEVNPAELSQERRNLIADRLNGIDVCQVACITEGVLPRDRNGQPLRIKAKLPTFESLMDAIAEDQRDYELGIKKVRTEVDSARLKEKN
jgi:hypothetical protein